MVGFPGRIVAFNSFRRLTKALRPESGCRGETTLEYEVPTQQVVHLMP
jgi:hypothetical protein